MVGIKIVVKKAISIFFGILIAIPLFYLLYQSFFHGGFFLRFIYIFFFLMGILLLIIWNKCKLKLVLSIVCVSVISIVAMAGAIATFAVAQNIIGHVSRAQNEDIVIVPQENEAPVIIEPEVIYHGALNVFNNVNVRNAPSLQGDVLRQSFFGEIFEIFETSGSGKIEDGVFDLWHRVSENEEWVNALFLRSFPFYVASEELQAFYGLYRNSVEGIISAFREVDGRKELRIGGGQIVGYVGRWLTLYRTHFMEMNEEYVFIRHPEQPHLFATRSNIAKRHRVNNTDSAQEYTVRLLNSKFENLVLFSMEIQRFTITHADGHSIVLSVERRSDHSRRIRAIYSPSIELPFVRIGSNKADIFLVFGDNYSFRESLDGWGNVEVVSYALSHRTLLPAKIEFTIVNGIVWRIEHSYLSWQ